MSQCDAEMCPFWTGSGCACEVLDIDEDERNEQRAQLEQFLDPGAVGGGHG